MRTNKSELSFFKDKEFHAFTALEKAHFISFAPFAFQASVLLRDYGILKELSEHKDGLSLDEIHAQTTINFDLCLNLPKNCP